MACGNMSRTLEVLAPVLLATSAPLRGPHPSLGSIRQACPSLLYLAPQRWGEGEGTDGGTRGCG